MVLMKLDSMLIFKYHYSILVYMVFCSFTLTFNGRVPVSPLIPYNIKLVQRGFTERAAFEERIPHIGREFTAFTCYTNKATARASIQQGSWLVHEGAWQWMRRSAQNSAAIVRVTHFSDRDQVTGTGKGSSWPALRRIVLLPGYCLLGAVS
jgi:hypothetical protein